MIEAYRTEMDDLQRFVRRLTPAARRRLLVESARALDSDQARRDDVRVGAVKVLVALYPDSKESLRAWLRRFDRIAREVHFTTFCFLDSIEQDRRELVGWVHGYLRDVKSNAAHAAWMAGDLLGDHWPLASSLPVLVDVARTGRFTAGRLAALYGLETAAKRMRRSDARRQRIRRVLADVQQNDRSDAVRSRAAVIARHLGRS